ncbi:DUF2975 domain-containing protein [Microlunatus parietis]|uniref:DUF2975 domain-containing protein n=1 Tax=Microlunatus parietis TaxID=682979 RepID=A0A7Y9I4S4_9ACTN|nr:DUF2975 domain-containing protein [Microlunatus parietis]NYE70267.1 hypothetical protein [Microlunatus parietis]
MEKQRWGWDRSDDAALRAVIIIGVLAVALGGVVAPLAGWLTGGPLIWSGLIGQEAPAPVRDGSGATAVFDGSVRWELAGAGAGFRLIALLPGLIDLLAVVTVALLLWRLLDQLRRDEPFSTLAVRATRGIAIAAAGWLVGKPLSQAAADLMITGPLRPDGFEYVFRVQPLWLAALVGVGVLAAVSEILRRGAKLRADVAGLV